jgi:serine/threonine protein kinase
MEGSLRAFSYGDLRASTRNFREELGEGGFGVVYKGYLEEKTFMPSRPGQGIPVAVKRLKVNAQQGHREWLVSVTLSINLSTLYVNKWDLCW